MYQTKFYFTKAQATDVLAVLRQIKNGTYQEDLSGPKRLNSESISETDNYDLSVCQVACCENHHVTLPSLFIASEKDLLNYLSTIGITPIKRDKFYLFNINVAGKRLHELLKVIMMYHRLFNTELVKVTIYGKPTVSYTREGLISDVDNGKTPVFGCSIMKLHAFSIRKNADLPLVEF